MMAVRRLMIIVVVAGSIEKCWHIAV
jgi:hypothetical protein